MVENARSAYAVTAAEALKATGSSQVGLSSGEAAERLEKFGFNELQEKKKRGLAGIFISQFAGFMILLLLAATVVAALLGEWIDAGAIAAILVLNAALGTLQEFRAEKALEALRKMTAPTAIVIRNGADESIPAREVVPGDIVVIEAGGSVPADCRLVEAFMLKTNEAPLTGESNPVQKSAEAVVAEGAPITSRANMLFAGTVVSSGRGRAVVVSAGMKTEFGKIASAVQTIVAEETPLKKNIDALGKQLAKAVLAACLIIFVIGSMRGLGAEDGGSPLAGMFLASVALAVAAIPEGLPATITIALAAGVQKMSRRNAVVRRLMAVEVLGSANVICADKTGTITKNEMTARTIFLPNRWIDVTGAGYDPRGGFLAGEKQVEPSGDKQLAELAQIAALCNNASIVFDAKSKKHAVIGDPTEAALLVLAEKMGMKREVLKPQAKLLQEFPFDSERKMMTVIYRIGGKDVALMKGAPEVVVSKCEWLSSGGKRIRMTPAWKKKILEANEKMAHKALRVLAFAHKSVTKKGEYGIREGEEKLEFVGLVGMIDAPREEVPEAIRKCREAGISVVMITGDNEITARAVAKEIGLLKEGDIVVNGSQLDAMSDDELQAKVKHIRVYARVSPEHKLRIVDALKAVGKVVAMTGDGANDAPALKRSDIGVSMGIVGTDVAKEVSDIVLADDNFASIVNAVEEGRGIYDNIRKCIAYLLSGNIAEVLILFSAIMLGLDLPLVAVQLLWINLVTDGIPALALSVDPIDKNAMKQPPRPKNESVWRGMKPFLLDAPILMTAFSLILFAWFLNAGGLIKAQTIIFTFIIVFEKAVAFSSRSVERPVGWRNLAENRWLLGSVVLALAIHALILYTPFLQQVFHVEPLNLQEWALLAGLSLAGFAYLEWVKGRQVKQASSFQSSYA